MAYIYFIDNDSGLTKIGRTRKHPTKRLKELPFPHLRIKFFFETEFDSKLEVALHNLYKRNAEGREWFNLNEYNISELKHSCEVLNEGIDAVFNVNNEI